MAEIGAQFPPIDPNKWRNLRRMGWIGVGMGVLITSKLVFFGGIEKHLVEILGFWGSVISLYAINSTVRDGWGKQ